MRNASKNRSRLAPHYRKDIYEYMSSVMSICHGDTESVLDNLQGMKSRRDWERRNFNKRFCAFDDLIDSIHQRRNCTEYFKLFVHVDYPLAIPWVPQTAHSSNILKATTCGYTPPFYTEMRVGVIHCINSLNCFRVGIQICFMCISSR